MMKRLSGPMAARAERPAPRSEVDRRKSRQQSLIKSIHHGSTEEDVGSPGALVIVQDFLAADIPACRSRPSRQRDQLVDVAQAEIEPLRADRRKRVRGVADEREPFGYDLGDDLTHHRKKASRPVEPHRAEHRSRLLLDLALERSLIQVRAATGLVVAHHPNEARAVRFSLLCGQRRQGERSGAGMEFGRGVTVRQPVRAEPRSARFAGSGGSEPEVPPHALPANCGRPRRR